MGRTNKAMLIGYTGDDIKMHYFDGGGCIGNVPLATTETYTNKSTGEKVENTEWHRLVFRNKPAEIIEKYCKKGTQIFVEGRIKYRKWQDQDGKDKYTTEIHVSDFELLGSKKDSSTSSSQQNDSPSQSNVVPKPPDEDDDLPF